MRDVSAFVLFDAIDFDGVRALARALRDGCVPPGVGGLWHVFVEAAARERLLVDESCGPALREVNLPELWDAGSFRSCAFAVWNEAVALHEIVGANLPQSAFPVISGEHLAASVRALVRSWNLTVGIVELLRPNAPR